MARKQHTRYDELPTSLLSFRDRRLWPTAKTRVGAVIGDPISQSLSPTLYNAAFAAVNLDWVYVAFQVPKGSSAAVVKAFRELGLVAFSVTMPHKQAVAQVVDELSEEARLLGAVNIVANREGRLIGHNTDGPGLVRALQQEAGYDPANKRCMVVGTGGAARAAVLALSTAGARSVAVLGRNQVAALAVAELAGSVGQVASSKDIAEQELIVNATPVGMNNYHTSGDHPIAFSSLHPGQLVVDMVYDPPETPLLEAAKEQGATPLGGLAMLVHQAAIAFSIWTDMDAPLEVMWSAVGGRFR